MARRLIRRFLPDAERIRAHPSLRFLGPRWQQPHLWHLNRHSVPKAAALGLFMAFMPLPVQSVPAAVAAFYLRANLPVTLAFVWATNPITMAPAFLLCYSTGALILQRPLRAIHPEISFAWLSAEFLEVWQPFVLGCFVVGGGLALIGYCAIRWLWRWQVLCDWKKRHTRRMARRTHMSVD